MGHSDSKKNTIISRIMTAMYSDSNKNVRVMDVRGVTAASVARQPLLTIEPPSNASGLNT